MLDLRVLARVVCMDIGACDAFKAFDQTPERRKSLLNLVPQRSKRSSL